MRRINPGTIAWPLVLLMLTASVRSQSPQPSSPRDFRNVQSSYVAPADPPSEPTPLARVLQWGDVMMKRADQIDDYSCTFIKREWIGDSLSERQVMQLRVRHRPFSVYAISHAPASLSGRQAVWVAGQNNGKMLAKGTGLQAVLGTISLDPLGRLAMQGNRYPITDAGIRNLVEKMIRTMRQDAKVSNGKFTFRHGAKVGDRPCVCIQVEHADPMRSLRYHKSMVYIDEQLLLPIHFAGYTWPETPGGEPVLIEEYTYANLKLNNGYTDQDFSL